MHAGAHRTGTGTWVDRAAVQDPVQVRLVVPVEPEHGHIVLVAGVAHPVQEALGPVGQSPGEVTEHEQPVQTCLGDLVDQRREVVRVGVHVARDHPATTDRLGERLLTRHRGQGVSRQNAALRLAGCAGKASPHRHRVVLVCVHPDPFTLMHSEAIV